MFWKTVVLALFVVVGIFADDQPPTLSDRNMCKRGKPDDKVGFITAIEVLRICTFGSGNLDQLKKDFFGALPNGTAAATAVLKKYTAKASQVKTCAHTLLDGGKPCLDNGELELFSYIRNATDLIVDFLSYNDGERVALFFSEQGPLCLEEKKLDIQECTSSRSSTPANIDPVVGTSISDRCGYYDAIYNCTMSALNGCTNPTPLRNLVESLYTTLRKSSPCNDALPVTTPSTRQNIKKN